MKTAKALEKQITKQLAEMLVKYQHIELKNGDRVYIGREILQIKRTLKELMTHVPT